MAWFKFFNRREPVEIQPEKATVAPVSTDALIQNEFSDIFKKRVERELRHASENVKALVEIYNRNRRRLESDDDFQSYYSTVGKELRKAKYTRGTVENLSPFLTQKDESDTTMLGLFFAALINPRLRGDYSVDIKLDKMLVDKLGYKLSKGTIYVRGDMGFNIQGHESENLYMLNGGDAILCGKISGSIGKGATGGKILIRDLDNVDITARIDPSCKANIVSCCARLGVQPWVDIGNSFEEGWDKINKLSRLRESYQG